MENDLSFRYSEVYAILNCFSEKEKRKIPLKLWNMLDKQRNINYNYFYVPGDEQYLSDDTIAILCNIYMRYLR